MRFEFDTIDSLKKPGTFVGKNVVFLDMAENLTKMAHDKIETKTNVVPENELRTETLLSIRAKSLISLKGSRNSIQKVCEVVESGGLVLVLNLKGDNLGPKSKLCNSDIQRREFVLNQLETIFSEYLIEHHIGGNIDILNKSHPLISELCICAFIVSKSGVNNHKNCKQEILNCEQEILDSVYAELRKNSSKRWTIIGDETGQFEEFTGKSGTDKITSTMLWLAIPPNTELPNLPSNFHGTTSPNLLIKALKSIDENPNLLIYSFSFEQGKITSGVGKIAKDPHLSMWNETLPLVLESLSNHISKDVKVDIYSEQVKGLEAGMTLFEAPILDLKTALNDRINWKRLNFEDMKILAKHPCEHPWMGYPDALGHIFNKNKMKKLNQAELFKRIDSRIIKSPFRQKSLNGKIKTSLRLSSSPLKFLKSLYGTPVDDVRDYLIPFFIPSITESLNSLNQYDWQKLLSFMKENSESGQNQNVSKIIHSLVDIDSEIDKFTQNSDKFDFALAILGTSNHIGARTQAEKCIKICEDLLNGDFIPRKNRGIKFDNLRGGKKDNEFNFSHIDEDLLLPNDSEFDDEWSKYLGAQALSRGLRGADIDFAIEIEDYLLKNTSDYEQLERRYLMSAELKFEVGEIEEGLHLLEKKLPNHVGKSVNELIESNIYYLPSLLKGCVLNSSPKRYFQKYTNSIVSKFNFAHPSQRTAYWCARWSEQIGDINNPTSVKSRDYLIQLMDYPKFTHDAPGIILACELLDLANRNLIDIDAVLFLEKVLQNSVDSTNKWMVDNQPNEYDWLAPLNFNYR